MDIAGQLATRGGGCDAASNRGNALTLLVILLLLLLLDGGLGDTVQITLTLLGDATTTLEAVLNDTDLLESLEDLAVDGAGGVDVVAGARATVLLSSVDLAETTDTDRLAHVDVAGDGGSTNVEPVHRLRRELLVVAGLDSVNPS